MKPLSVIERTPELIKAIRLAIRDAEMYYEGSLLSRQVDPLNELLAQLGEGPQPPKGDN